MTETASGDQTPHRSWTDTDLLGGLIDGEYSLADVEIPCAIPDVVDFDCHRFCFPVHPLGGTQGRKDRVTREILGASADPLATLAVGIEEMWHLNDQIQGDDRVLSDRFRSVLCSAS